MMVRSLFSTGTHLNTSAGTWIWGRGACDDKAELIERLVTVETLLKHGFSPARTIVLAFGFDEEATGREVGRAS